MVLSKIVFYLLQDGSTVIGSKYRPRICGPLFGICYIMGIEAFQIRDRQ